MLDTRVSFYVPSTQDVDGTTNIKEFEARAIDIAHQFGVMFGGFTITDGIGGWVTDSGKLVVESVKIVTSYADIKSTQTNKHKLADLAATKKEEWGQEAIGLEVVQVNGGLEFV